MAPALSRFGSSPLQGIGSTSVPDRPVLTAPCPAAQDPSQMIRPPEGSETSQASLARTPWARGPGLGPKRSDKGLYVAYAPISSPASASMNTSPAPMAPVGAASWPMPSDQSSPSPTTRVPYRPPTPTSPLGTRRSADRRTATPSSTPGGRTTGRGSTTTGRDFTVPECSASWARTPKVSWEET
jgi:hypothetical protein